MVVGADCRSLRPRPRADADDSLLLGVHVHVRRSSRTSGSSPCCGCCAGSASAASSRWAARSWPRSGPRIAARWAPATCTPATTSASSSRRSRTTTSARTTGGDGCSSSAARPALLVGWIQSGVREPATWQKKAAKSASVPAMREAFAALFSPEYKRRTIVNSLLFTVSIVGLWAGSIYVPDRGDADRACARATRPPRRRGWRRTARWCWRSRTIIGCLMAPWLAERLGRRLAMGAVFRRARRRGGDRVRLRVLPAVGADAVLRADLLPRHRRRELRDVHAVAARAVLDRAAAPAPSPSSARSAASSAWRWCFSSAPQSSPTAASACPSRSPPLSFVLGVAPPAVRGGDTGARRCPLEES